VSEDVQLDDDKRIAEEIMNVAIVCGFVPGVVSELPDDRRGGGGGGGGEEGGGGGDAYDAMYIPALKELLGSRELVKTGNKPELIDRLRVDDTKRAHTAAAAASGGGGAGAGSTAAGDAGGGGDDDEDGNDEDGDSDETDEGGGGGGMEVAGGVYDSMNCPALRDLLETRKLKKSGNKPELIDRLRVDDTKRAHTAAAAAAAALLAPAVAGPSRGGPPQPAEALGGSGRCRSAGPAPGCLSARGRTQ